ncbi:MAG TPA: tetratricopeptide repeat protein [Vicinamibacterales bacterium]|nr:tetratricopeptide repeat protein [Vicinamibacterales bacterium]
MKRTERQHLRENELEQFARQARELVEAKKRETTLIVGAIVVVGAVALGYFGWHQHVQSRAHDLLAQAVAVQDARVGPPPAPGQPSAGIYFPTERERAQAALTKFKAAADAYPSTDAGLYARYQEASLYLSMDNPSQAAAAYQQVIDRGGSTIYGQMARLGLAEAQARAGQYDQAINTFKELAQRKDGPLPVDGILMQLGRTYLDAGKRADAQQTFNRLVQEYPESPFTTDAKRELDALKKTT